MLVQTKHFGEIDLDEDKILTFEQGIFGFEECKKFTLLYDSDDDVRSNISWFQCLDNVELALPVISPSLVMEEYNPIIEDELLEGLGDITQENVVVLLTLTVPGDLTNMTTNLKAPLIINADTKKGCQVVAENSEYVIKYPVYELFSKKPTKKGDM